MGHGREVGGGTGGAEETQTGDQGLSVISCPNYIDELDGQTMCDTFLWK